ncbi:MAG: DUF5343 domain-containing protein [Chloroflexi bacterium]|nr:DUF5343 domain-containing protein [Chloroflexota bacterium]
MVTDTERQTAPYAPVNNVLTVLRRLREHGLPEALSFGSLERIGIPAGNAPRTLAALRFLGLVDEEGQRKPAFERLARAKSEEYNEALADIVRAAYAAVFGIVDPEETSDIEVADAFRGFEPQRQRDKMITLFMGLCREAGIVTSGRAPEARPRRRQRQNGEGSDQPKPQPRQQRRRRDPSLSEEQEPPVAGPDLRLLSGLMQQLPKDGKWTQERRDRWLQAMAANVDVIVQLAEPEE